MRDRLVELLDNAPPEYQAGTKAIADHLLANGVIVPPCKVGDKLYAISISRIAECTCEEIQIWTNGMQVCADFQCDYDCKDCPFNSWKQDFHTGEYSCDGEYGDWFFSFDDFGKTVFLTRQEAEQALSKLQSSYEQVKGGEG